LGYLGLIGSIEKSSVHTYEKMQQRKAVNLFQYLLLFDYYF